MKSAWYLWSTDDIPTDPGVGGSRVTHVGGQVVYGDTREIRHRLVAMAADLYGWSESQITFQEGQVVTPGQPPVSLADLVARTGVPVAGQFTDESERD